MLTALSEGLAVMLFCAFREIFASLKGNLQK
jgi:hypothetical protein